MDWSGFILPGLLRRNNKAAPTAVKTADGPAGPSHAGRSADHDQRSSKSRQGATPVRTTCPYCGVGCGVLASAKTPDNATTVGDTAHPANFGRLCVKGSSLAETLSLKTRLLAPQVDGHQVPWSKALDRVARDLARIRDQHGPESIAFYLSGQLLTEDYYVANKLAKGFIGTPHVDTNSRLCMASSVAGHKRAFGEDIVPQCYEDLDTADLIILSGSNAAWCHPILFQRMQDARKNRGTRVVVIDPRRTATCEGADLHLPLQPGSDQNIWNALLVAIADRGLTDLTFINQHTDGYVKALAAARVTDPDFATTARATGIPEEQLTKFVDWWCDTDRVVSCYSQGVNQSHQGADKVNAILNCHLATGRIGREGCGPLSLTGQPNAMGGREVGGLANMLAAHIGFSERERDLVGGFWQAPNMITGEGLKAVQMFDAIADGRIKALWVMGTNPAVSLPRADQVRDSLRRLECFVVSENVTSNDTADAAPIRLPAAPWSEKDGTVTNSERRISRQRGFTELAGETRPDWWIMQEVAQRLGYTDGFNYTHPAEIFREHAALSAHGNSGERLFNIGALATLSNEEYDDLEPIQWPCPAGQPYGTARLFADGSFATPDHRARFIPIAAPSLAAKPSPTYPLILNTGRVRDQWHTMTRTGLASRLSAHIAEPFLTVHPADALSRRIENNDIIAVTTEHGRYVARAQLSEDQTQGQVFAPIHWSGTNTSQARIGAVITGVTDPVSGQPETKAMPAEVSRVPVVGHGMLHTVSDVTPRGTAYWSSASMPHGVSIRFALAQPVDQWQDVIAPCLPDGETVSFFDPANRHMRTAVFDGSELRAFLVVTGGFQEPSAAWLKEAFSQAHETALERRQLLAGKASGAAVDDGPIVCVCHQIGRNTIAGHIEKGCSSSEAVGDACKAGTNCGSCVPEIRRLIAEMNDAKVLEAAE
ncbi:MAG: molybdopterin-dependent oxidoreductase [Pseudomonadota bacterium]